MKIKFKSIAGNANKINLTTKKVVYLSSKDLEIFDGVEDNTRFSEYFDTDYNFSDKVIGGYLKFEYDKVNQLLYTTTEYNIIEGKKLTEKDIEELKEETVGQWSDGIGEGFEQEACVNDAVFEYYIEPYNKDSEIETIIEEGFVQRNPIHKFKFYVNSIESDIYEYNEDNYSNYEDLIENMEEDRVAWVFNTIDSGWVKIT